MGDVSGYDGEADLHEGPIHEEPDMDVCDECETVVEVLGISIETSGALEQERHYRVIELACGHQIATPVRSDGRGVW